MTKRLNELFVRLLHSQLDPKNIEIEKNHLTVVMQVQISHLKLG